MLFNLTYVKNHSLLTLVLIYTDERVFRNMWLMAESRPLAAQSTQLRVGLPNISEIIPGNVARSGGLEVIKNDMQK